jgi:ribosomal protein L40E
MSVEVTTVVVCDPCGARSQTGIVADGARSTLARRRAHTRERFARTSVDGEMVDLCRECAANQPSGGTS